MPSRRSAAPRSLTDELRSRPDDALAALLRDRPDLAVPLPPDLSALGVRAAGRLSVQRALDALDAPSLQVLEIVAVLPEPVAPGQVSKLWAAPAGPTLERLRRLALLWGAPRSLRLVRAARDVLGAYPAGLGPPIADALGRRSPQRLADLLDDLSLPPAGDPGVALARLAEHLGVPAVVAELLEGAPAGVHAVLERLIWGPPVGQVSDADRPVRRAGASGAVEWLLARGLLGVADAGHVVLPREVGLALRGGRVHREPLVRPPAVAAEPRPAARATSTAAGAAAEAVRLVGALGDAWGDAPPPVLRAGGLGVRDLRRTAATLEVDEATAARVVEVAFATGLVADDGEADPHWAPTPAFDAWLDLPTGSRWAQLATAWLATTRSPGLVGTRDERDSPRAALGGDLDRAAAPDIRRWVLDRLAETGTDADPQAADPQDLLALLDWTAPRRAGRTRAQLLGWALDEAGWLGVTGAGALAPHGRLLRTDPAGAAAALDASLPPLVDRIFLQADLTAVAPGPLVPELDRDLALVADVESRGGATVFRFTPRVGPAGARRRPHGRRPARAARALVEHAGAAAAALPRAGHRAPLRADPDRDGPVLRARRRRGRARRAARRPPHGGPAAAPAGADGAGGAGTARDRAVDAALDGARAGGRVARRRGRRPGAPRPPHASAHPAPPRHPAAAAARRSGAAGCSPGAAGRGRGGAGTCSRVGSPVDLGVPPVLAATDPASALALLRDAASARRPVWIGYADARGVVARRLVEPLSIDAGRITAFDRGADQVRTFSVHRVTGVAPPTTPTPTH